MCIELGYVLLLRAEWVKFVEGWSCVRYSSLACLLAEVMEDTPELSYWSSSYEEQGETGRNQVGFTASSKGNTALGSY